MIGVLIWVSGKWGLRDMAAGLASFGAGASRQLYDATVEA
jgi:hypothetical protein